MVAEADSAQIFREHAPFVARFLSRLGIPLADVDDVVQEVFLWVYHHGGFDPTRGAKPTTYLASIALRFASNHRRRVARRSALETGTSKLRSIVDGMPDPVRAAEVRESAQTVQQALQALPEDQRAIFVLFELEGESCPAIADVLGIPTGTVYSRLHTARKRFNKAIARVQKARERSEQLGAKA